MDGSSAFADERVDEISARVDAFTVRRCATDGMSNDLPKPWIQIGSTRAVAKLLELVDGPRLRSADTSGGSEVPAVTDHRAGDVAIGGMRAVETNR